jgi:O-methyltransferase involved in polyketide biosynthesis
MLSAVSKTAILTLRARADEHRLRDRLFADPRAVEWLEKLEWPRELDAWYNSWTQTKTAFRADQIDQLVKRRIAVLPAETIVAELGSGLSTRWERIGAGARWIDLDLPEMIEVRRSLGAIDSERHRHVASSVLDPGWYAEAKGAEILIAEGLLYYLPKDEVDRLFLELRKYFPGATIIFDVIGAIDFKPSLSASARVGAPIRWMVEPPFESAMTGFGLETIPGFEPCVLIEEMIDRFGKRFGRPMRSILKGLTWFDSIRDRRSGVMIGRLA